MKSMKARKKESKSRRAQHACEQAKKERFFLDENNLSEQDICFFQSTTAKQHLAMCVSTPHKPTKRSATERSFWSTQQTWEACSCLLCARCGSCGLVHQASPCSSKQASLPSTMGGVEAQINGIRGKWKAPHVCRHGATLWGCVLVFCFVLCVGFVASASQSSVLEVLAGTVFGSASVLLDMQHVMAPFFFRRCCCSLLFSRKKQHDETPNHENNGA